MPRNKTFAVLICAVAVLAACDNGATPAQASPDEALGARVESALENASDLPVNSLTVVVSNGIVTLTGSVVCDECGGNRTPAGAATVQQSLGAVVRAVPGVERVEFDLQYQL